MPDQPADPIHYDMKIPPDPHHGQEKPAEGSSPEHQLRETNSAQPAEEQRTGGDASTSPGAPEKP